MKLTCMRRLFNMMALLMSIGAAGVLSSCDGAIYDDEGDCSVHYRVTFTYDMNMKFANAFAHEVKSLTLYVYDRNGNLVMSKTDSGPQLESPDYSMEVDVAPGKYDLLVWAEGESPAASPVSFTVHDASPSVR